ncbi:TetR/AcrR family transcriptional regulator [Nocardia concava]|uniref:TetR/AcrR family transcriptional regulator n=1 Tax=Nocardia concava TaxID=257281 RepID=UPI00031FB181|nr:TetR/AcrR family transcriptional regulator C-terminal domain-containing protein [Nocardia concava]
MSEVPAVSTVWARPPRRERPGLTVERIVAEAISLMDDEGLEALTMRALGVRLRAGATSVYRHVANREELLELAVDHVFGEIDVPACDAPGHFRATVIECAESVRTMVLRHRWIAGVMPGVGLHYLGPNVLRLNESLMRVFDAVDYPADEVDTAIATVLGYVVGMSFAEAAWLAKVEQGGKSEQECVEQLLPVLERAVASHPRVAAAIVARGETDVRAGREAKFRYGLERVLDGLTLRFRHSAASEADA